ncbi:MAG: aminotransferase class V-fold PLP-dependent enzyme [Pseudomonadales bacterium]|nr:aminotransferase class V-fold PLP-dependent enzyme [Pseudomonadales bacterium]MEE2890936.1 aminotransferase class V-fold PLP-dependent enzyme [Pseudomonadota bacterium]
MPERLPVYLDYAATTPVDPRVAERVTAHLTPDGVFGNPASRSHIFGWDAEEAVEQARVEVASLLACDPREVVWTSGATESDNLAIQGVALAAEARGRHLVTCTIEHKAVIDTCRWLEGRGWEVSWLEPGTDGRVAPEQVAAVLRDDTVLVSLMLVNNELGVITDIAGIAELLKDHQALLHVDAAQALGKIPVSPSALGVDLMAFSGHKLYAPKGIGVLYVRNAPEVTVQALMHGGGHERGFRSGTLPTHQIVGMGAACAVAEAELAEEGPRIARLRDRFLDGVSNLGGIHLNGHAQARIPGIVNLAFEGVDGEALLMALAPDIACSSGSACNSAFVEPSFVLRGIGLDDTLAQASLRFSFGRFTTEAEVDQALDRVVETVSRLRRA